MVDHDPKSIDPKELETHRKIDINPKILHDERGRLRWVIPGNTLDQNLQLGINNVQALFLKKFPEFDTEFPRLEDGTIVEKERDKAKIFIYDRLGKFSNFQRIINNSVVNEQAIPYFGGSHIIAVKLSFAPWGLDFGPQVEPKWMTRAVLTKLLLVNARRVSSIAEKYSKNHPAWFRSVTIFGRQHEQLGPELVMLITGEIGRNKLYRPGGRRMKVLPSPEGWVTNTDLSRQLGNIPLKVIKELASDYRKTHPQYFGTYTVYDKPQLHYSPELVQIITNEVRQNEKYRPVKTPGSWKSLSEVARTLRVSRPRVKAIVEEYKSLHPEWRMLGFSKGTGKPAECISPELIEIVTTVLSKSKSVESISAQEADERLMDYFEEV